MPQTLFLIIAVFLRIVSNPLANVFQKRLTIRGQHPLVVNFLTYLFLSILCLVPATQVSWQQLPPAFWIYSTLGGAVGALGNGFLVKALQRGELSVLGPINAYKSVVSLIVGIFLLGEIPGLTGLLGVALIVYGSYFVLGTDGERFSWQLLKRSEIQFRLWALLLTAIEAVFTKKYIQASSVLIATIGWCWFGAVFSFLLLLVYRLRLPQELRRLKTANAADYLLLISCIGVMQATTNYAFDHLPVAYALALFQLSVLVSVLLGYRIFKEGGIRKKLIGSVIMLAGSVIIILLK